MEECLGVGCLIGGGTDLVAADRRGLLALVLLAIGETHRPAKVPSTLIMGRRLGEDNPRDLRRDLRRLAIWRFSLWRR